MSATGDFFGLRELQREFYVPKRAPQAKILGVQSATNRILPCKINAAGENFAVSDR